MGELSTAMRTTMAEKLDLPADATAAQVFSALDYTVAKADAVQKGTVSRDPIRASLGISDSDPERVVAAGADTIMLRKAKSLGLSASTPPKEIRVGIRAAQRVAASRRVAASQPVAAGRVAAATQQDLTGVYAMNPLVAQAQVGKVYASAVEASGGSAPTLFRGGDLPAFTASGVSPELLARIPWTARHAVATEPDRSRVLEMFETLSGPDGPLVASEYASHLGNKEYTDRVIAWQQAGWDLTRQRDEDRRAEVEEARQGEVRAALGDPSDWTDEQAYEHIFGHLDRRDDEKKFEDEKAILDGRTVGHGRDLDQVRASMEARIAASGGRFTDPRTAK